MPLSSRGKEIRCDLRVYPLTGDPKGMVSEVGEDAGEGGGGMLASSREVGYVGGLAVRRGESFVVQTTEA